MNMQSNRTWWAALAMLVLSTASADEDYRNVSADLTQGLELQAIADNAYEHAEDYWEFHHAHPRDGHDHPEHGPGEHDGTDERLSAGEAVTEIYTLAVANPAGIDPMASDIVNVTIAVIDAWPDCQDTFDAVRAAVTLMPRRADEIVARVAVKRDCNCSNGGLWVDHRLMDRIRVAQRHEILEVPVQCSCSQVAMYGGIAGLPENREFDPERPASEQPAVAARMTESVAAIIDRTASLQSKNGWQCGCTDVNIAAAMQGIEIDELRDVAYEGLARKYVEEAGDTGMVVDSFGTTVEFPPDHWGEGEHASQSNVLRRQEQVFRGDNKLLDAFDPQHEFAPHGDRNFDHLGEHRVVSEELPTDLIISEYLEGWNEEALELPEEEREPHMRNRLVELHNGTDETIDLGNALYFLEIYQEDDDDETSDDADESHEPRRTITLSGAIEPGASHIVVNEEADEHIRDLAHQVTGELDFRPNETLVVRRAGGEQALYCRVQGAEFVTRYPPQPFIRITRLFPVPPPDLDDLASPN